ncbi:hypothetical protein BGZ98_003675 [Dissophora globulifera]|nr:hypothetical protein BGZ98_003675 [Dissophora globulifera]
MFSSFKERLNTGISTLQERGHAAPASSSSPATPLDPAVNSGSEATHSLGSSESDDPSEGVLHTLASPHSPTPTSTLTLTSSSTTATTPTPTPSVFQAPSSSFASLASRISSGVASSSSTSLFFRRPTQRTQTAADLVTTERKSGDSLSSTTYASSVGLGLSFNLGGAGHLAKLVQELTLDPREEKADPLALDKIREKYRQPSQHQHPREDLGEQPRDAIDLQHLAKDELQEPSHEQPEQPEQRAGTDLPEAVVEQLEVLQRYETRFPDLARAFKKIVQEKVAAEAVLKATTTLDDLGDVEALEAHMQNVTHKSEMSMQEIRRLSDELRATVKAMESKDIELASQQTLNEELRNQIASQKEEIDLLRSKNAPSSNSSDTASINLLQPERHSDVSTLVRSSFDLTSTSPRLAPTPSPPPIIPAKDQKPTDNLTTPPPSESKKSRSAGGDLKNQALRELMARLEAVLREKNQAQEELEDSVEEAKRLSARLEKEIDLNKEMTEKMDRLQSRIAEMEERMRREASITAAAVTQKAAGEDSGDNSKAHADVTTLLHETMMERDSEDTAATEPSLLILQEELSAVQVELETVLKRETEATKLHKEVEVALASLHQEHESLLTSKSQLECDLATSTTQIKELRELALVLGETKQDLVEAQEEIHEKQRLLELERNWREEAEQHRDRLKREHDVTMKSLKRDLETAAERERTLQQEIERSLSLITPSSERGNDNQIGVLEERIKDLEQQLALASDELKRLELELASKSEATNEILSLNQRIEHYQKQSEEMAQQIAALSSEKAASLDASVTKLASINVLRAEADKNLVAMSEMQQQDQSRVARIQELESELANGTTRQADSLIGVTSPTSANPAEIQMLRRTPSMNSVKILRQELSEAKKAREVAENTITILRANLEAARARQSTSAMTDSPTSPTTPTNVVRRFIPESDSISPEALSSLKQEREELSEKLARLERLHQGFEHSFSEKMQALEQELALLIQQKVALEAQVQEQSDLLIKEKEKEKELEQARVADGIERVTLELAAVRSAERFASDKVTELSKDRDMVAEKVVRLEQRLEELKECKVGHEQSLAGRIEELIQDKQSLETQLSAMKTGMDDLTTRSAEEIRALQEMHDVVVVECDQSKVKIAQLEAELKVVSEKIGDANDAQELREQLTALKAELQSKSKKFEIAQGQAQVQRTLHTDKVAQLTDQIQTLKTERDSLMQPKVELETQLQDAKEQAKTLREQLKVLEEDNERLMGAKTEAQEQMSELQSKITALGLRERDLKEALLLAKETIHQRDEDLSATRSVLKAAESDLEKALQKLSKLETDNQSLTDEIGSAKTNLSKAQQETKAVVTRSTSQQSATAQELQRLKATHVKVLQERDRVIQERDKLLQEKEANEKEVQMKQAELDTMQRMHDAAEAQLRDYQVQLTEARNRVDTLEELTSIAKRVAESKVVEFEALTNKSSDLEAALSRTEEQILQQQEEFRKVEAKLKADIEDVREVLGEEISDLMEQAKRRSRELELLIIKTSKDENEIEEMRKIIEENTQAMEVLEAEMQDLKNRKRNLELELQHFKDLEEILAREKSSHEAAKEEFKMRESHLRSVNKTLKEEVRKLQKHLPGSPLPSPSSPYPLSSQNGIPPQTPGGQQQQQAYSNTPSTPKPRPSSRASNGRAASSPAMNMTPPATPRFQRQQSPPDEDVNIEYLRNVLLNFMEHKDRRQQLIPVVAQMLRLSTDETHRFSRHV